MAMNNDISIFKVHINNSLKHRMLPQRDPEKKSKH